MDRMADHWKTESDFVTLGVTVKKLVSQKTGLTVYLAPVDGPLCHGYFCVVRAAVRTRDRLMVSFLAAMTDILSHSVFPGQRTEAHDDDGLPHTLEHIVFMGSDQYPYKVRACRRCHGRCSR